MVKLSGQTKTDAKSRILDAADDIFVRRGIDGARMQEIADHAGVNKALLHDYVRSKAELARAVWLRIASLFVPGVLPMMASDLPFDDKIDRFVDADHTTLTHHPYLMACVISEAARHPDLVDDFCSPERRRAARKMIEKLRDQIDNGVKTRELGLRSGAHREFMERRRTELPAFLKMALHP